MKSCFLTLLIWLCVCSCKQEPQSPLLKYSTPKEGFCRTDSRNRFHFTKPENASGTLPLLIILDSGGDGLFALKKVTPALSHIPCVAIASDVVKNNFADYESAIEMLISEASRLHPVDINQVFLVGFSGAARMAFSYSTTHSVSGVIMCSAAPPRNAPISCPVYVISGTADFNFGETYRNPLQPGYALPYKTDYFKGIHAWPPVNHLEDGLFYLMLRSIPDGEKIIQEKVRLHLQQSDSNIFKGDYLLAWKALEKARTLDAKNKKVRKALLHLKKDKNCKIAFMGIESDLVAENSIFQSFSQAMTINDSVWWKSALTDLDHQISDAHGSEKDHFMRIKGFLGIAFYSQLNFLFGAENYPPQIIHILAAYKTAEPDNPDVYYAYARYAYKMHQSAQARTYLIKAMQLGYSDHSRIKRDFPEIRLPVSKSPHDIH